MVLIRQTPIGMDCRCRTQQATTKTKASNSTFGGIDQLKPQAQQLRFEQESGLYY